MNDVNISVVIKNMTIQLRKDGRLEGRITIGDSRRSFYGKTKTEVRQKAKEYLQKISNGYKEPKKITLNEYIEYWLLKYKLTTLEPSAFARVERVYRCQIKNTIGKNMIGSVTRDDIQNLIDRHANPKDGKTKALAVSGLKRIKQLLASSMKQAVKDGIIAQNPCEDVLIPKERYVDVKTKRQITLNDAEIDEIKMAALAKNKNNNEYKSRNGLVFLLILNLGLRASEMLALEWNDINWDEEILHINKTVQSGITDVDFIKNKNIVFTKDSTKTENGIRVLKMNDAIVYYLKELQEYDKRHNICSKYVCSSMTGTQMTIRNLQTSFERFIKRTNIQQHVTLHTLRHTYGSVLLRKNIPIEVVSKLMGHANIHITYTKYIHVLKCQEAKAMQSVVIC